MELLTYLTDNGMFNNTIVVFTCRPWRNARKSRAERQGRLPFMKTTSTFRYILSIPITKEVREFPPSHAIWILRRPLWIWQICRMTRKKTIAGDLAGHSLLDLMDGTKTSVREGSLFCFEMLSFTAMQINVDEAGEEEVSFDTSVRGVARGLVTEKYKFVRYFSAGRF